MFIKNVEKIKDGSYVKNCLLKLRPGEKADAIFYIPPDKSKIIIKLENYVILPIEEYQAMSTKLTPD